MHLKKLKQNTTPQSGTLLRSQSFQSSTSSSWWNWILLQEWGRYVCSRGLLSSRPIPRKIKLKSYVQKLRLLIIYSV